MHIIIITTVDCDFTSYFKNNWYFNSERSIHHWEVLKTSFCRFWLNILLTSFCKYILFQWKSYLYCSIIIVMSLIIIMIIIIIIMSV